MKKLIALLMAGLLTVCAGAASAAALRTTSGQYGFEYIYGQVFIWEDSNVYEFPGTGERVLGRAASGQSLDFLGDIAEVDGVDWYRVVFGSGTGWVSGAHNILLEDF